MKTATTNGAVPTAPVDGRPTEPASKKSLLAGRSLLEAVEHEAGAYRAWNTPEGDFLAEQLERTAQLIAWTGASTPAEFRDRLEVWDRKTAEDHFERGRGAGYDDARFEFDRHF